jgi:hypothetical protein
VVLSKREKNVGIVAGAAMVILLLNFVVVDPLMERRDRLENQKAQANAVLAAKVSVLKKSKDDDPRWKEILRSGLLKDASAAESQAYSAVTSWARESGLNPPPSLKTDHTEKDGKDFYKITIRATANAGMSQIARFLWHFENANLPIRVTELNVTSRKEGTDDLSLSMSFTTIYMAPESENKDANKTVAMAEVRR